MTQYFALGDLVSECSLKLTSQLPQDHVLRAVTFVPIPKCTIVIDLVGRNFDNGFARQFSFFWPEGFG